MSHSPSVDLIAERNDNYFRIQVKTASYFRNNRFAVCLAEEYDYFFVLVADDRKWFIPSSAVGGQTGVLLGGPKYQRFEVDAPLVPSRR